MRAFRLSLIVVVLSLTGGCPTAEVEPGLVWNPTLNESGSGGELDLGTITPSESTSGQIVVWNNTEDDVAFDITCNLTEGGWIISCPTGERVIPPTEYDEDTGDPIQGTFLAVGPSFQSPAESDYDGTIAFGFDNRIVTYVVRVSVVAEE